jgi:hypothetical protein
MDIDIPLLDNLGLIEETLGIDILGLLDNLGLIEETGMADGPVERKGD